MGKRPASVISKRPSSLVAPNRFLRCAAAMLRIPLAVELQDHVDDMLEHLRSAALLRNMAHEEHGDALFFRRAGTLPQPAHLSQTPQPVDISRSHGLNGIDDHKLQAIRSICRTCETSVSPMIMRSDSALVALRTGLERRFFARDDRTDRHFNCGDLQEKRRLADAGLAAEQHDRARQEPAQHPVGSKGESAQAPVSVVTWANAGLEAGCCRPELAVWRNDVDLDQ